MMEFILSKVALIIWSIILLKANIIASQHQEFCLYLKSTNESFKNFLLLGWTRRRIYNLSNILWWSLFAKIVKSWKPFTIFAKNSIRDVRLGSKYTSDVQTFERKTQQKFVSCQDKLLSNSFFQRKLLALKHLWVFVKS